MRSIFFGVIVLLASTAVVDPAQAEAEKHGYAQAFISHRQPIPISRENLTLLWHFQLSGLRTCRWQCGHR